MNVEVAKEMLRLGAKISHDSFTSKEWVVRDSCVGRIIFEDGCVGSEEEFWRIRENFDPEGWKFYELAQIYSVEAEDCNGDEIEGIDVIGVSKQDAFRRLSEDDDIELVNNLEYIGAASEDETISAYRSFASVAKVQNNSEDRNILVQSSGSNNKHFSEKNFYVDIERVLTDDDLMGMIGEIPQECITRAIKEHLATQDGYAISNVFDQMNLIKPGSLVVYKKRG